MEIPDVRRRIRHDLEAHPTGHARRWSAYWLQRAEEYILGQVLPGARKSMQPIAAREDLEYHRLQHFITYAPWSWEEPQSGLVDRVKAEVATPTGLVALDDTAFPKQGTHSVGVARQYCGALGKVANCQAAVTIVYVQPAPPRSADAGVFPMGMRLYLPEQWANDAPRRRKARVPREVRFREKWRIGLELIQQVREREVPHEAVTADASFGSCREFRAALRQAGECYVVGVDPAALRVVREGMALRKPRKGPAGRPEERLRFPEGKRGRSALRLAGELDPEEWQEMTWAEGTRGELKGTFARVRVRVTKKAQPTEEVGWLLFERRENETKAYLCHGFDESSLEDLVRVARGRWPIEQFFREAKDELGMDHFEGRTWPGWHHHVTLTLMAYSFLARLRWEQRAEGEEEALPTFPEVRREVVAMWAQRIAGEALRSRGEGPRRMAIRQILALVENAG